MSSRRSKLILLPHFNRPVLLALAGLAAQQPEEKGKAPAHVQPKKGSVSPPVNKDERDLAAGDRTPKLPLSSEGTETSPAKPKGAKVRSRPKRTRAEIDLQTRLRESLAKEILQKYPDFKSRNLAKELHMQPSLVVYLQAWVENAKSGRKTGRSVRAKFGHKANLDSKPPSVAAPDTDAKGPAYEDWERLYLATLPPRIKERVTLAELHKQKEDEQLDEAKRSAIEMKITELVDAVTRVMMKAQKDYVNTLLYQERRKYDCLTKDEQRRKWLDFAAGHGKRDSKNT